MSASLPRTRLGVVGSRCLKDSRQAQAAVLRTILYWQEATPAGQLEIVSGGAEGPDAMAEAIADNLGLPKAILLPDAEALRRIFDPAVQMKPADRRREAWGIYKARNVALVGRCTHLVAVRCPQSDTHGAFWTEQEAQRRRVTVLRPIEINCGTHRAESA